MNVKIFQLHKRSAYIFKDIQDKYSIDLERNIFSISDGATQGYKSEVWAENLVSDFLSTPVFQIPDLIENLKVNALRFSKVDFPVSDNYAIKALEVRKKQLGSFATFLGTEIKENKMKYISSGDVCGFISDGENLTSFPFSTVDELDKDKGFLGTVKILNNDIYPEQFKFGEHNFDKGTRFFLMTDAIARMCLRDSKNINLINSLTSFEAFKDFIVSKWDSKELEEDDITVLILDPQGEKSQTAFLPPDDFFFPKEDKPEYTKISTPVLLKDELTEQEMKEIQEQLNLLHNKINDANQQNSEMMKHLKTYKLLTLLSLGLVFSAFLLGGYLFRKSLNKAERQEKLAEVQMESVKTEPRVTTTVVTSENSNNNSERKPMEALVNSGVGNQNTDRTEKPNEPSKNPIGQNKNSKEVAAKEQPGKPDTKALDKEAAKKDSVK